MHCRSRVAIERSAGWASNSADYVRSALGGLGCRRLCVGGVGVGQPWGNGARLVCRHRWNAVHVRRLTPVALAACLAVVAVSACASPQVVHSQAVATTPVPVSVNTSSQSPHDAARDGIVPALAALPLSERVDAGAAVDTTEGRWVFSTPDQIPAEAAPNCALGDPLGTRWRDFLCLDEYGEILLMNADHTRIIRAFPLPYAHTTTHLVVTDKAVYCASSGDGGLPDSLLCRIDRRALTMLVRVFPWKMDSAFTPPQSPDLYAPAKWVLDQPRDPMFYNLAVSGGHIRISEGGNRADVDPQTLQLSNV